jgi:hypothetical protein
MVGKFKSILDKFIENYKNLTEKIKGIEILMFWAAISLTRLFNLEVYGH